MPQQCCLEKSTPWCKTNRKHFKSSSKNTLKKATYTYQKAHTQPLSFSLRRKTDNFDLFKTTDDWTNGPYTINIFFHLSANSFRASKKHPCSLNSTYAGDTTMYALKRATNEKLCSSQIKAYSNQESCSSVLQTPQPHSKPWWMPYLQKNYVKIG